jgi:predicted kinase
MSGSGKTTWITQTKAKFKIISQDYLREQFLCDRGNQNNNSQVLNFAMASLKELLRKKEHIAWDATSLRRDMRDKIIRLGENYHALVTLVFFHLNEEDLRERNLTRTYSVPEEVLNRQLQRFQWPQPTEAHRFLILDRDGNTLHCSGFLQKIHRT